MRDAKFCSDHITTYVLYQIHKKILNSILIGFVIPVLKYDKGFCTWSERKFHLRRKVVKDFKSLKHHVAISVVSIKMTTDFFPYKIENKNSTCPSVFVKCNCMYEFCGSVWCSKSASCSFLFHQCHINNGSVKGVLTRGRQNGEGRETNSLKCSDINSHTIKSLDKPMVALIVDVVDRLMMMAAWAQKLSVINKFFFTSIKEKKPRKLTSFADHHYCP